MCVFVEEDAMLALFTSLPVVISATAALGPAVLTPESAESEHQPKVCLLDQAGFCRSVLVQLLPVV